MTWKDIKLNNGGSIPGIGFGTWKIPQNQTVENVDLAIELGFNHVDTAQAYGNEEQVGQALKQAGLSRESIWVTTKWSGTPGHWGDGSTISPEQSITESLQKLGLTYLDLYLVHTPRLFSGFIRDSWPRIAQLQLNGQTRSVGVSNFTLEDMKTLLEGEKRPEIIPAVNQIELHPYIWKQYKANVEYCQENGIAIEAYSPLKPLTTYPGGPLDKPLLKIAAHHKVKPEQILLAWIKSKGCIALTTSTRKERLTDYVSAGSIKLSKDEIHEIEKAGAKGPQTKRRLLMTMALGTAAQVAVYVAGKYFVDGKLF